MRDFTGVSGATDDGLAKDTPAPATRWPAEVANSWLKELKTVITHEAGGDTTLNPDDDSQLLVAIGQMVENGFANREADARFSQIERVVEDEQGGDVTPYAPGNEAQLLNAILAMIVRAAANIVTIQVESGAEKTITFGGGVMILKQGYVRQTFTSEVTVPVAFQTPFPGGCWVVLTQGVLSSANIYKDLWTQVIDPTRTQNGFTVQLQSDDDNDHGLAGFDWVAIGN